MEITIRSSVEVKFKSDWCGKNSKGATDSAKKFHQGFSMPVYNSYNVACHQK